MGSAAKENSVELSGILPSAFARANQGSGKPAAKTESFGTRRALAPKPANVQKQSLNSPQIAASIHPHDRGAERDPVRVYGEPSITRLNNLGTTQSHAAGIKKPRLSVMEDSGDEDTEDESNNAGVSTPLSKLAARRTVSRSRVLYPRPVIPKDLGTLELDYVTAPPEPSLDEITNAAFEALAAQYPPPQPATPRMATLDDFPDLDVDFSSDEEDESIAELKTPSH